LSGSADGRPCPSTALFSLIAARYERRSILLTSNKGFGEWLPGRVLEVAVKTSK